MWLWRRSPSGLGETLAEARRAWDAGDYPAAAACYEQLARAYPDHRRVPAWWFNAALAHKFLRDWPKAYELGREAAARVRRGRERSEEHTSELQSRENLVCRLLLEKKKKKNNKQHRVHNKKTRKE